MMKKTIFFIILSLLLLSLLFPHLFATIRGIRVSAKTGESLYLYKNYYALVVGVSDYERWPKLPNAVNDAKEVASRLKELGFEAKLVVDPTSREMKRVLNEMVYDMGIEENRALLFYYAGHGETETLADKTKMGYIIPRDCPILDKDPKGFATRAISMRDIESASLRIKSKHVLMLFDSCFSGSLFALVRAAPDDITEKSTLPVRQYITAGREDEQVPDKSMFKRCFLIGLEGDADLTGDGYITGSELGMYLSDKVVNYTHRSQHPQYGKINNPDLDRGDFIFALKTPSQPSPPASGAPAPSFEAEKQRLADERELLERERQELERLKMEIERKRLEAEKEKLTMVERPPRLKAVRVTDTKTDLSGRLLGLWRKESREFPGYRLKITEHKGNLSVKLWDSRNTEGGFSVKDVSWDGKVLSFTSVYLAKGHWNYRQLTLTAPDTLSGAFTSKGGLKGKETWKKISN